MADTLRHRGPDDSGLWLDPAAGIGLGHRRLSIIDLSPAGHQPMVSASGRRVIVFNGEIYNYRHTAAELAAAGVQLRGTSDTEVLLAAIEHWGLGPALRRSTGMFAFALWDAERRTLTLGRDRFGEKPLYYGLAGPHFVFASELKAFRGLPGHTVRIDRMALEGYLRLGYVPAPLSMIAGFRKLPPGHTLTLDMRQRLAGIPAPEAYWQAIDPWVHRGQASQPSSGYEAAVDEMERTLRTAVREQMVSDVPLGAFLSGGVDSSAVVALMQSESPIPVRTFSIRAADAAYDEADFAAVIARHLGTDHTEIRVGPADALALIPDVAEVYDEPFADSSQLPTMLLCARAREHVTVALTGDGGDEVFGGYNRHLWAPRVWARIRWLPVSLRAGAEAGARVTGIQAAGREATEAGPCAPGRVTSGHLSAPDRLLVGAAVAGAPAPRAGPLGPGAARACDCSRLRQHHDVRGHHRLSRRRHPRQGGPGQHGQQPGVPGSVPGPPRL
jgi:asparagine synthase (glutamine-hydrolysing)